MRKLLVVAFFSLASVVYSGSLQAKRYIVHYQNSASTLSGSATGASATQKKIVNAGNVIEARALVPIGNIVEVEEDIMLQAILEPGDNGSGDQFYNMQWHYFNQRGGIELPSAWDITTGNSDVVVAVVDTGITIHPDLDDKVVSGADVISDTAISNDGNGRDMDASDPGDYVDVGDPCFSGFPSNSSWHGTHVAGTVAAKSDNGLGVTGVSWGAKIQPVRALGKCGGWLSDIADGIRWAAGGSVPGLGVNQTPADVINLSLGGRGSCSRSMQDAIDFAFNRGVVVVVAAGNDQADLDFSSYVPANCRHVINVGAGNQNAFRAFYSNYGDTIDIMGPGGDFSAAVFSTYNDGTTTPNRPSYRGLNGTSMAAPHVAGVAALIKSVGPGLFPAQVEDIIKQTAKFFNCDRTDKCGSGLVDAFAAVQLARITPPDGTFQGVEPINPGDDTSFTGVDQITGTDDRDGGGACGTISFVDGGNPPKGGLGAFLLSLILGVMVSLIPNRKRLT